jgi:hypothetical protein
LERSCRIAEKVWRRLSHSQKKRSHPVGENKVMKRTLSTAVVSLMIAGGGALHAAEDSAPRTFTAVGTTSTQLATALEDIKTTLSTPRTPLQFDNGSVAINCAEYSNLVAENAPLESVRNAEIRAEYLVCDAVRFISKGPFLVEKHTLPATAAKALFEHLDLRSFPSSLRNRASGPTHTLKTLLASGKVKTTRDTVEVETDEHSFSLQIAGVVSRPISKGGMNMHRSDWIVWVGDEMKDGNYKSYRTLIVRPPNKRSGGRYTGSVYPPQ